CCAEEAVRPQPGDVRLLACGSLHPGDPHFSDLMTPEAIASLVRDERTNLDRIVVDLPSADDLPTLRPLLDMLDGVILVAEAGKTNIDDVIAAVQDLESSGCTVLGVVLNKTNATPAVRRGTLVDALVRRAAAMRPSAQPRA
ncbi:CpsD/CapB family tyrosine-protein kinase, partial [Methylobacterium sp. WL18]